MTKKAVAEICAVTPGYAVMLPARPPRCKTMLKSSCALTALAALPAAMSLGVSLISPAQAQTVIDTSKNNTVYLSNSTNYPNGSPFTITSGTTITTTNPGRYAVIATASAPSLSNYGVVISNPTASQAISLLMGGAVYNAGTVAGGNGIASHNGPAAIYNTGTIIGSATSGIDLNSSGTLASSTINNSGLIQGNNYGVQAETSYTSITNNGTILQVATPGGVNGDAGVYLHGTGAVANGLTGFFDGSTLGNTAALIQGTSIGVELGAGIVGNAGTIIGTAETGLLIKNSGSAFNAGLIHGGNTGIYLGGSFGGVENFDFDGTLSPVITGAVNGVLIDNSIAGEAVVLNGGTILAYRPDYNGFQSAAVGVLLSNGGSVSNGSGGLIAGAAGGVSIQAASGSVANQGIIRSANFDGTDVSLAAGGVVTNEGSIYGGGVGVGVAGGNGSLLNSGIIDAGDSGVSMTSSGYVVNSAGGYIRGDNFGVYIAGGNASVGNSGVITTAETFAPAVLGASTIRPFTEEKQGVGVYFANGGTVHNYAGGTISGTTNGVEIEGGVQSFVTNDAGGTISGGGNDGVLLNGSQDQLSNAGYITGGANGAVLGNGGYVNNSGLIVGSVNAALVLSNGGTLVNSGTLNGYRNGVDVSGQVASITNSGLITTGALDESDVGVSLGAGGGVTNTASGTIYGSYTGVAANGALNLDNSGTITGRYNTGVLANAGDAIANRQGGLISSGYYGVKLYGTGTVTNAGVILAGEDAGIYAENASVSNTATGTINAGGDGIYINGANSQTVINSGAIYAGREGIYLGQDGSVTNAASGIIKADSYGIDIDGAGNAVNAGTISANTGIYVDAGNVTNSASGVINAGDLGVYVDGTGSDTVVNAGTINTNQYGVGVYLDNGGSVSNVAGALINSGSYGVHVGSQPGHLTNAGTILASNPTFATGVLLDDGGSVANYAGGVISGTSYGIVSQNAAATVANAGTIIGAVDDGVSLNHGGVITNYAGGIISGGHMGAYIGYSPGMVTNSGLIIGGTGDGVSLYMGGNLSNTSTGTIVGGYAGVFLGGTVASTLQNDGVITGTTYGVLANGAETLTNTAAATIVGGVYGVDDRGGAGVVTNSGSIIGVNGTGVYLGQGGTVFNNGFIFGAQTGAGIYGQPGTIFNNGGIIASGTSTGYHAGVVLSQGGYVNNSGVIGGYGNGPAAGISAVGPLTLVNDGRVAGFGSTFSTGVYMAEGGTITNNASAVIAGGSYGVIATGNFLNGAEPDEPVPVSYASALITNSGSISGGTTGIKIGSGVVDNNPDGIIIGFNQSGIDMDTGIVNNSGSIYGGAFGVSLRDGYVNNNAGGTIAGERYAGISAEYGSVVNAGLITGGEDGIGMYKGSVVNNAGGTIIGTADDGIGMDTGSVGNAGFIEGQINGVAFYGNASSLTNSGTIIGETGATFANGGTVTNSGVILGDTFGIAASSSYNSNTATVLNSGTIGEFASGSGYAAITLGSGGTVVNEAGGLIAGDSGIITAGQPGSVDNAGIVNGYGTNGIQLVDGGTVTNRAGGAITGYANGLVAQNGAGMVYNYGQITGTNGTGVQLEQGGLVENAGGISGGAYGVQLVGSTLLNNASGRINGGSGGVQALNSNITNSGTITGGAVGVGLFGGTLQNNAGALIQGGDIGLYAGDGAVVFNAGTILDANTAGAVLGSDVSATNEPGGNIAGATGVSFLGTNSNLFNAGTIASTMAGGNAIAFDQTGTNHLTLATGSTIIGAIDGGGSDSTIDLVGSGGIGTPIQNFGAGSALTVDPGANWTATGNWMVATVTNQGTFQPGIIGTPLDLTGNFVQTSGGSLRVVVTPTQSSQFAITGTAQLNGNLTYVFAPGRYTPQQYNYLTATGGVTGTYSSVTYSGDVPFELTHSSTFGADNANLVLADDGLVEPGDDSIFSAENQQMAEAAQLATSNLLDKAAASTAGAASEAAACKAEAAAMPAANSPSGSSTASRMTSAVASAFCGAGGWIEATGTTMNVNDPDGVPGYHADTGGFLAGIDKTVNNTGTRVGLAVGYDGTWLHDGLGGKATIDTTRFGVYGAQPIGRYTLAADFLYGHADNTVDRATGIGVAHSSHGSDIFSGGLQGSTDVFMRGFTLTPAAGVRVASVNAGGFTESGVALQSFEGGGGNSSYTSVQPFLKLGISKTFFTANAIHVTPSLSIGYNYEAGNRGKATVIAVDGFTFATPHNNLDASTGMVSAGIAAGKNNWSLYARYTGYVSGNWNAQAGEVGLQVKF